MRLGYCAVRIEKCEICVEGWLDIPKGGDGRSGNCGEDGLLDVFFILVWKRFPWVLWWMIFKGREGCIGGIHLAKLEREMVER